MLSPSSEPSASNRTGMQLPDFPVTRLLPELRAALASEGHAILVAPPGAGKTTILPPALLNEPWLDGKKIIMLEPRRLATRGAAWRIAELLGERPGQQVGYRMRGETIAGKGGRIEVVTEGILTRILQNDPMLEEYGLVIFDEFHERNLHGDVGLALLLQARRLFRDDLRILVMSATIEAEPVAALLDGAPILESEGKLWPVTTNYLGRNNDRRIEQDAAAAVARAIRDVDEGDLLLFLPGLAEIRRTEELLRSSSSLDVEILPLHSSLSREEQDRALGLDRSTSAHRQRRVILATSIAETSLTIEGISVVIDSGLSRLPRFDPNSGMSRLVTTRVSQASADQRRGRAGRRGPGFCYRLWDQGDDRSLLPRTPPEILEADLLPLALDLLSWGSPPEELSWIDPPPAGPYRGALDLLYDLEATDSEGNLTDIGREMARLPVHPRLAHMILRTAEDHHGTDLLPTALLVAPLLEEGGSSSRSNDPDIRTRLDDLILRRGKGTDRIIRSAGRLAAIVRALLPAGRSLQSDLMNPPPTHQQINRAGEILARAYPDRIARKRSGEEGRYTLSNGPTATLQRGGHLTGEEYLVVPLLRGGRDQDGIIDLAAPIDAERLSEILGDRIVEGERMEWDEEKGAISVWRERRLGSLLLDRKRLQNPDEATLIAGTVEGIRRSGLERLPWSRNAIELRERLQFLRTHLGDEWPDYSDATLLDHLDEWLPPLLSGKKGGNRLGSVDLPEGLLSRLTWEQRRDLDRLAPERLEVPSGSHIRIDYSRPEAPVLPVRLQEMFGALETPRIAAGRVPLTIHLLSPAHRPVQVTRDLAGFWERTYSEVRKELKGRYPKHSWPDDPLTAVAVRGTGRKGNSR